MKRTLWSVMLLIAVIALGERPVLAQSQPADSYSYSGLAAGLTENAFADYKIDDFFFSYLNESGGSISIQTKLTRSGSNAWADCSQTGSTFTYSNTNLSNADTYAWNVVDQSVLADTNNYFNGSLSAVELNNIDFYIGPPTTFTASSPTWTANECTTYYNAWESGSWTPPWFWDGSISLLVSPYANEWHNDEFWDKGWNTSLQITNNGTSSISYTVDYIADGGGSGVEHNTSSSACTTTTLNSTVTTPTVSSGGGTWSSTLDNIFGNPTEAVEEDGAFTISLSSVIAGTTPSSTVSAFATGSTNPYCVNPCVIGSGTRGLPLLTSCY